MSKIALAAATCLVFLFPGATVTALSCARLPHQRMMQLYENVLIAEVVAHHGGTKTRSGEFELRILLVLKNGGLFQKNQRRFSMPDNNGWGKLYHKKGQILLLYFGKRLFVKCNYPVVIK